MFGERASEPRDDFIERNVLVVAGRGLRRRRKDRLRKTIGLAQPSWQANPANASRFVILLPSRSGNVSPHNALNWNWLRLPNHHRPPAYLAIEGLENGREMFRGDEVILDDVVQIIEPKNRDLREHTAFVGNRSGQNYIEGGKPVRRDNEEKVALQFVDIADLPAAVELQCPKICLRNDRLHRRRRHEISVLGCEGGYSSAQQVVVNR